MVRPPFRKGLSHATMMPSATARASLGMRIPQGLAERRSAWPRPKRPRTASAGSRKAGPLWEGEESEGARLDD